MHEHLGTVAGIGLIALAGAYDYLASDTISEAFRRNFKEHPVVVGGAYALLTAHLFQLIPEKYDPLTQGLRMIKAL